MEKFAYTNGNFARSSIVIFNFASSLSSSLTTRITDTSDFSHAPLPFLHDSEESNFGG